MKVGKETCYYLSLASSFEAGREESSAWPNQAGEDADDEAVNQEATITKTHSKNLS